MSALAIASALAFCDALADDQKVEEIIVTASPLGGTADQLVRPVEVVSGEELDRVRRSTIGDTLENQPGVSTTDFGAGAGRPVIRGQGGPRIQVLENGIASMDASDVSTDHAVTIDPAYADQVEILKGPATLLNGGGASAGVVNIVDQRLPTAVVDGLHGSGDGQYNSNGSATTGTAALGYGIGNQMFRAQYSDHNADNYDIPGWANTDNTGSRRTLANSEVWSRTGALSYGYITDAGSVAASAGRFQTRYGLPVEETAFIDMNQDRYDVQGILNAPTSFLDSIKVRGGYNDYDHTEFEAPGVPGTVFSNKQSQVRIDAVHTPVDGWRGAFGIQYDHRKFSAVGEEAFVPQSITEGLGVFLVEERPYSLGTLELGVRVQRDESDPTQGSSKDFTPISISAGSIFDLGQTYHLKVYATRSQRSPVAEELYAFGPHGATATFERGDENLDKETANNIEVSLDHHGERLFWQVNAYYERIEDYIYLQEVDTGLNADGSGVAASDGVADRVDAEGIFDPAGELLLVDYQQKNAEFYGFEAQMSYVILTEPFALNGQVFADKVIGQLTSNTNLPRIPPARYGFGIDTSRGPLSGNVSLVHAMSQDNLGPLETPTNGYTMVTVDLGYRFSLGRSSAETAELYLQGRNVLDEEGRRATSFLKDVAPLPGASLVVGLRVAI
jgi:iron complex outermembrane receptor protein